MSIRALWAMTFLAAGCSSIDPGGAVERTVPLGDPVVGPPSTTTTPKPKTDGGVTPPVGTTDAGGAVDAAAAGGFFAGAYASSPVGERASTKHAGQGFTNPAGRDCMTCHKTGGVGTPFLMGGTVYDSVAGTTGLADIEIRIVGKDGVQAGNVHSDADGNFWLAAAGAVPAGSKVGVRNAAGQQLMAGEITTGSCSAAGCHITGAAGPIHLP